MPSVLPDLSPLRASRDFRLLWIGQFISSAGSALRLVAIPYQIYVLTGSTLAVGLLGLFAVYHVTEHVAEAATPLPDKDGNA